MNLKTRKEQLDHEWCKLPFVAHRFSEALCRGTVGEINDVKVLDSENLD